MKRLKSILVLILALAFLSPMANVKGSSDGGPTPPTVIDFIVDIDGPPNGLQGLLPPFTIKANVFTVNPTGTIDVVGVPGLANTREFFTPIGNELQANANTKYSKIRRLIAFDQMGHGDSESPFSSSILQTLNSYALTLGAVLDQVKEDTDEVILLSHSMGGTLTEILAQVTKDNEGLNLKQRYEVTGVSIMGGTPTAATIWPYIDVAFGIEAFSQLLQALCPFPGNDHCQDIGDPNLHIQIPKDLFDLIFGNAPGAFTDEEFNQLNTTESFTAGLQLLGPTFLGLQRPDIDKGLLSDANTWGTKVNFLSFNQDNFYKPNPFVQRLKVAHLLNVDLDTATLIAPNSPFANLKEVDGAHHTPFLNPKLTLENSLDDLLN